MSTDKSGRLVTPNEGPNRAERRKRETPKLRLTKPLKKIRRKTFIGETDITNYEKYGLTPHQAVQIQNRRLIDLLKGGNE